jgi:predicted site-specific integrase-resolvase
MKLSAWARQQGLSYKTAWRLWRDGKLPVPAEQLPTGTVVVHFEAPRRAGGAALYARVSLSDQKEDLARQLERLRAQAAQAGLEVVAEVAEVGSGLNGARPKLLRLLSRPEVAILVVEHRERLARFGVEYLAAALAAQGRRIEVLEEGEVADDIVRDLYDVIVSLCARLYGRRSARHRAHKAMDAIGG